jgi:hypothetical protein
MEVNDQLQAPAALPKEVKPPKLIGQKKPRRPRAGLDTVKKRKTSCPCRELNPESSVVQPRHYSD